VGNVSIMQIQEVGSAMVRFEDRQVFLLKMRVPRLATVKGEKK
jgi:hypothetical protein